MLGRVLLIAKERDLVEAVALLRCLDPEDISFFTLSNRKRIDTRTYLTKGKLKELKEILSQSRVERVYVYDSLSPRQSFNLMKELKVDVIDKIGLILEIFALHAGSKEAKLQIEMARLLHQLPLIKEWVRKAKMKELPGFLGPGAYAIDTYYKHMKRRLVRIRRELRKLRERRQIERERRVREGFPHVSITGYTNAGKTTLFNTLTHESKPVGPEMFTTISPKRKRMILDDGTSAIAVDTVGFIRRIPAELIEAFYATLEEVSSSDLTLLVIDSSEDPIEIKEKLKASLDILRRIGYVSKPLVIVINKIDLSPDGGYIAEQIVKESLADDSLWTWTCVKVSAINGLGISRLREVIKSYISLQKKHLRIENRAQARER